MGQTYKVRTILSILLLLQFHVSFLVSGAWYLSHSCKCSSAVFIRRSTTVVVAGWGNFERDTRIEQWQTACCWIALTCKMMVSTCFCTFVWFFYWKKERLVPISTFLLFHSANLFFLFLRVPNKCNSFCLFFAHVNNVNTPVIITSIRSLKLVGLKEYLLLHSYISVIHSYFCYSKCGTAHHNKLSSVRQALVSVSSPMKALSIEGIHVRSECFQIKHFIII